MRTYLYVMAAIFGSLVLNPGSGALLAQQMPQTSSPQEKIIIDTDIGDDIDDAFAVALAVRSPELDILGICTEFGDTETRAKILDRMLGEIGRQDIPVAVGVETALDMAYGDHLSQRRYGEGGHFVHAAHPRAVDFILDQIRHYPGQITLVTIGPLTNVGAIIDRSPETFRRLKRIVMMGGSVGPVRADFGNARQMGPVAEWNIKADIVAAQKMFLSGVPIFMMPTDSTAHLKLNEVNRNILFSQSTPLTDALTLLYHQWSDLGGAVTPTLFDAMTIAYLLEPGLCPVQPMDIFVDDKGFTRVEQGTTNAQVCLHSEADAFFRFYMNRLVDH